MEKVFLKSREILNIFSVDFVKVYCVHKKSANAIKTAPAV